MASTWSVPADSKHGEIGVDMLPIDTLAIRQGDAVIELGPEQLSALADKLYFLDMIYRADVQEAVDCLL